MVSHWNLEKSLPKRCLTLSVLTFTDPLPTPLSIAVEEDQGSEVTSIRHTRQSSPVPRYNQQTSRSDTYSHSHRTRSSYQPKYSNRDRCHSYSSPKNQYSHNQANNMLHNANDMHPLNMSELIGSLQSQIIGL